MAESTATTNEDILRRWPVFLRPGVLMVILTIEISVQLWKSIFCLGGISFFLFILLTITGLFLMFYYVPAVQYAYQNMKDLQYAVSFGVVMRNLHRWGAHAMVITVWLHMCRVFYTGSYKPPREFNWGIGVLLLLMTLL